jgi:hypothetical protein
MPARVIVSGMMLVIFAVFMVFAVEFFLPLSAKADMNMYCRSSMLKMETEGGMSSQHADELKERLMERGFKNVIVDGTVSAKQGEKIHLKVEADYAYSKLTALFIRKDTVNRMMYDKISISRRVIN